MNAPPRKGLNISVKSFLTAIAVIFVLMVASYILTLVIPGGEWARTMDANGNLIIDTSAGYRQIPGGIPFRKRLLNTTIPSCLPV